MENEAAAPSKPCRLSVEEARAIAQLLKWRDTLMEWAEMINDEKSQRNFRLVSFSNIAFVQEEDGLGPQKSLDGSLIIPRDIAARMMCREIEAITGELTELGVSP